MGEAPGPGLPTSGGTPEGAGDSLVRGCGSANFSCGARCSADGATGSTLGERRAPEVRCSGASPALSLRACADSPALTVRSLARSARWCWRCEALRARTSCAIPLILPAADHCATAGMALDAGQGSAIKSSATTKNGAWPMSNAFQSTARYTQMNHRTRARVPRCAITRRNGLRSCAVQSSSIPLGDLEPMSDLTRLASKQLASL